MIPYSLYRQNYLTSSEIIDHLSNFSSKIRLQVLDVEESNIIFQFMKSVIQRGLFFPLYSQYYICINIQLPTYFSRNFQGWFTLPGNIITET